MSDYIKLIGFKAYKDRDDDILEWWLSIPNGERSQVLRTLIRAFLNGEFITTPEGEAPTEYTRTLQLSQLQAETRWIRTALMDMPDYLEGLFSQVQQTIRSRPVVAAEPMLAGIPNGTTSETEAEKRAGHVARHNW